MDAARIGDHAGILKAIDSGADVNAVDYACNSALLLASESGDARTIRFLAQHGAHIDSNALHRAAAPVHANADAAKLLLELGAAVNTRDRYGRTPLFTAIKANRIVSMTGSQPSCTTHACT